MKTFEVSYAGAPRSAKRIAAATSRDAALEFFSQNPCRNSVFVSSGFLSEEIFGPAELICGINGLNIEALPFAASDTDAPQEPQSFWEKLFLHALLGPFYWWR